jgi:uncharacterized membrane-anchored protein YhcB (DUF1043 family)
MPQNEILATLMSGVFVSIMSGIVIMLVKRGWTKKEAELNRIKDLENQLDEVRKSLWTIKKTLLISAKILDEQTEREHPELSSNLEDIASELLGESNKG